MKKKWFLYFTGFFSGMSVMAIELGASRLLAPYFSSSQIIWTIIIGMIMIAMALGNVIGGKMADKHKTPKRLFIWLFAAAIWTALIPVVGKFIIAGVALVLALFVTSNYLVWASMVSCLLVFVFPLLVLGMVTPNLIKFSVSDLESNGKTVGIIEALNTIGSIIGTFLPTFVTIPLIGTAWTFFIFAFILFVIVIMYFIFNKSTKRVVVSSIVAVLTLSACGFGSQIGTAFWSNRILYEGESIYNYLRVEETDDSIILSTNVLFGVQSIKMKEKGLTGLYYDYALAAPIMAGAEEKELDMLILGLGTGTFATQSYEYFDNINIDGVEIDQKIVDLAYKYFELSKDVNVFVEDGRAILSQTKKKYDVIMVDAYQDITIPFQMTTIEFFTMVKDHLSEDGVMVVNLNMRSSAKKGINEYLCNTIKHVFNSVYTVDTAGTNTELFASNSYDCSKRLDEKIQGITDRNLKSLMNRISGGMNEHLDDHLLLTDDEAPVELLGMSVLDEMIASELDYFKETIKNKSLKDLFEMLLSGELF